MLAVPLETGGQQSPPLKHIKKLGVQSNPIVLVSVLETHSLLSLISSSHYPFSHTTSYMHSFVPATIGSWNHLDEDTVLSPFLASFKFKLHH